MAVSSLENGTEREPRELAHIRVWVIQRSLQGRYRASVADFPQGNGGFLAHYKTGEEDMAALRDALRVHGSKGTVNTGTGFVSYGVIANSKGYVAGESTTAFEMGRLEEALGLIK